MSRRHWLAFVAAFSGAALGCAKNGTGSRVPDGWIGRWQGPEGTYLEVAGADGKFEITGMKWLAGKTDCLTVRLGEGYCRD